MTTSSPRFHYGWLMLGMGMLAVFGSLGLARFGYAMVLPEMKEGLDIGNTEAGAIITASLLGYLALSVIGGALATRFGPRAVIAGGLAVAGTGMIFTGMANGFTAVMAAQLLTGMGSGAGNIPVVGLVASWVAPRRLGVASGVIVSGSSLGLVVVGTTVPVILSRYDEGWRACWYVFGAITIALALLSWVLLRNQPSEKGLKPLGFKDDDPAVIRRPGVFEWSKVYRSRAVWQIGLVYIAFGLSYIIYMTFFREQLANERGYTDEMAGSLYMMMGWVSFSCGPLWGYVSDRIGRRRVLMIIYTLHAAAFSLFGLWTMPNGFMISAILFGLTAWSIPAIMTAMCGEMMGAQMAPATLGFITLFFGVGQALGPIIAGGMADAAGSLLPAYLFAAGVAAIGAIGASRLKPASAASSDP
ncbi:MAG: MFS transporter [Dehalococcoidia bacterium]|nr:MFS transporter [Dehalococcoidia bacterium]